MPTAKNRAALVRSLQTAMRHLATVEAEPQGIAPHAYYERERVQEQLYAIRMHLSEALRDARLLR
jgi:hypothetical protein